jgi:hypothetical protein
MSHKLLTAIEQINSRNAIVEETVRRNAVEWVTAHQVSQRSALTVMQRETVKFLNVQRLMTQIGFTNVMKHVPLAQPKESLRQLSALLSPSFEEERALQRHVLPINKIEELSMERVQRLRPEEIRQQIRQIALSRTSINLIDQTAFAMLESYLWKNFPLQVYQILGELLEQVVRKSWYLDRISGLESLEKLMLQMYVYAFMEFPLSLNMLGMKVTPLSMTVLRNRTASIYMTYWMQNEDEETKQYIGTVQARKPETKAVTSGKTKQELVPNKENIGTTENLTEDTLVSAGRDMQGKEGLFLALRYAYSMPFWLRRMLARNLGMPENHKYARYFGIGCIPTRYARYSWKYRRYSEESFTNFRRDEWLKMHQKFEKLHRVGVPYKGRYGSGKIWTTH